MSAQHTSEPWARDGLCVYALRFVDGGMRNRFSATVQPHSSCSHGEAQANARLMAASPNMRELLERAKEVLDNYADVVDDCDGTKANPALSLCGEIDALLAKIDGVRL